MKKIWTRVIGTVLSVSMLLAGAPLAGAVDGLPTILRLEKDELYCKYNLYIA